MWLNQFIFDSKFSYETVEIGQMIHNIMFFFRRQGLIPPKMKENSETGYTFPKTFQNGLKAKGFWGTSPRQLVIKYPPGSK